MPDAARPDRRGPRPVLRVAGVWLSTGVVLFVLSWLLPGFRTNSLWAAFLAAALLGLANSLVWPVLVRLALPLTVLTLGLLPLVLNGALIALVAWVLPDVELDDLWTGILVALGLTAASMLLTTAFALDDDEMFFRRVVGRRAPAHAPGPGGEVPGVLFLQIDGLAHAVLRRAVRDGNMPTLAGWLARGSHRVCGWETDWSSQTGASQAGILLGSNDDMPAFRWMEKETGLLLVSNHPKSAAEIERRRSTGRGLLHADGASRGNIFTGDAEDSVLTMSSAGRRHGRIGAGYYAYFSRPYTTSRTLLASLVEVGRELAQASAQRHRDVRPRVSRRGLYPLLRAFTTVVTRDVTVATLIGDMRAGRSVVYADFVGYDEVAHHSGVERHDALDTLRRLDREFGRLERAASRMARPYVFVVLSDHGQSQGPTFLTRYGESLTAVVTRATGAPAETGGGPETESAGEESWGYAGGAVQEVAAGPGLLGRAVGRLRRGRGHDSAPGEGRARTDSEAVVLASGNCGLVYLTRDPHRMPVERIEELYPRLVPTLVEHPGVGFVLVRSAAGPLVLGRGGTRNLTTGEVTGWDPLAGFGPSAARQVARTDGFPHCADLMVNSLWDAQTEEVAAFEELVGSHGGLGGEQTRPFVLYPATLSEPAEMHGAEEVHQQFRRWLAELGHTAFAAETPIAGKASLSPAE